MSFDARYLRGETRALYNAFLSGRPPQAALIAGRSGLGKRTLALALSQIALCTGESKPCGECGACRRYLRGSHPDFLPLPGEGTVKLDDLRGLLDALSKRPLMGGGRVVYLPRAERMTQQAQNCLLKTLEEPDAQTLFLLTADSESALLPTVRSRCRIVRAQPWTDEDMERFLREQGVDDARAKELTALCEGSPGLALTYHGDEKYASLRRLVEETCFSLRDASDLPEASRRLKDLKDDSDIFLDILESESRAWLTGKMNPYKDAPARAPERVLQAVLDARRDRAVYVTWQAVADRLLSVILEETLAWQR